MATVESLTALVEKLSADLKALHRDVRKIRQVVEDPTGEKAELRAKNNGFKKPMDIDDALRSFLGHEAGAQISRSDVTKAIDAYAVANNLKNGKVIQMDDKLKALLNPPDGVEVSYLKLQHFLAPHYIKSETAKPTRPRVKKAEA
jgi:chromatin remodeling complex protein RSC6